MISNVFKAARSRVRRRVITRPALPAAVGAAGFRASVLAASVLAVLAAMALALPVPSRAADLGAYAGASAPGAACDSAEAGSFASVWLGHFTGGYSQYSGPGGTILLDWHDEKLCFPTRRTCDRWIASMRRDFHHPEGYFTCLTIR